MSFRIHGGLLSLELGIAAVNVFDALKALKKALQVFKVLRKSVDI